MSGSEEVLTIYDQDNGFFYERKKGSQIIDRAFFEGSVPRLDIWQRCPELWYWLAKNEIFNLKEGFSPSYASNKTLKSTMPFIGKDDPVICTESMDEIDFITSMIDVLETDICKCDIHHVKTDYQLLCSLEMLCHERHINLYDFFLALETDSKIPINNPVFIPQYISVKTYYQALEIFSNVKGMSFRDISHKCGVDYRNIISDKNDAFRGKRKTMSLRMLYLLAKGVDLSINAMLAMCYLIQRYDLYNKLEEILKTKTLPLYKRRKKRNED